MTFYLKTTMNQQILTIEQYNNNKVTFYGTYEEPLFNAIEISKFLDIRNIDTNLNMIEDKYVISNDTILITVHELYILLAISKLDTIDFQKWTNTIMKNLKMKYNKQNVFESLPKYEHVYVIQTDINGIYKIGRTNDVPKRIKSMQTSNVEDIQIIIDFRTCNSTLLELCVHSILKQYRCNPRREFFKCNIDHIKNVIRICGNTIDLLSSCKDTITTNEINCIFKDNDLEFVSKTKNIESRDKSIQIENQTKTENVETQTEEEIKHDDFIGWLNENIEYKNGSILQLKDVCENYFGKFVFSRIATKYKEEIEKWIKSKYPFVSDKYRDSSYNNQKVKGWVNLNIITQNTNNDFNNWLNENIEYKENGILKLDDICMIFLDKKIGPRLKTKFKNCVENFIKNKFPTIDNKYQDSKINDIKYKGWKNLNIITQKY